MPVPGVVSARTEDLIWASIAANLTKRRKPYEYPREPYIRMLCGHYTDATEQNVMRLLDSKHMLKTPRRVKGVDLYWCSQCNQWVDKYRYQAKELPEEPMF
jgi:hypothetical protein